MKRYVVFCLVVLQASQNSCALHCWCCGKKPLPLLVSKAEEAQAAAFYFCIQREPVTLDAFRLSLVVPRASYSSKLLSM